MNILIPIDDERKLCSLEANSSWSVVTFDEGQTKHLSFYKNKEEINELVDYVVVISKDEFISDFFFRRYRSFSRAYAKRD